MLLEYRKTKGYKYLVAAAYRCAVPELTGITIHNRWFSVESGEMTVQPGYAWDGASGPTIDTPATMKASLVHDVGYQCVRAGLLPAEYRGTFDSILFRMMRPAPSAAIGKLARVWAETRALYYFVAVRAAGWGAVKPQDVEPQDQIYTVA
jgi:hypothetical protein